jgi:hypothetical protein
MQTGNDVAVCVERDGDVGVAQPFLHHLRMDAGLQRQGCPAVPKVMQPDSRQSDPGRTVSRKPRENRSGCSTVPPGWQKTRSLSVHLRPSATAPRPAAYGAP